MSKNLMISTQSGDWYEDMFGGDSGADDAFKFIKECGFDAIDYNLEHTIRPGLIRKCELNDYLIMATEKLCAVCQYIGCPAIVLHPSSFTDKEKEHRINMDMYRKLIPAGKKYGVKLCLENMFMVLNGHVVAGACADAEAACRYIDELNAEAGEDIFGFCLDIGHANITSRNIRNDIRTLGHRLTILHIHDNDAQDDLHLIPYTQKCGGEFYTDWEGVIDGLRDIGYRGVINFETFASLVGVPQELFPAILKFTSEIGNYFKNRILK